MRQESIDKVLQAADEGMTLLGFNTFDAGVRFACETFEALLAKLRQIQTRDALAQMLADLPEPDPQELDNGVSICKDFIFQLRRGIPDFIKAQIPHAPGGRPAVLTTPEDRRRVCQEIAGLFAQRVRLTDAQKRIAQKHGVSLRTIQRIWKRRGEEEPLRSDGTA